MHGKKVFIIDIMHGKKVFNAIISSSEIREIINFLLITEFNVSFAFYGHMTNGIYSIIRLSAVLLVLDYS